MAHCFINGEFLEEDHTHIPIDNIGVHRGFGIFDFFRSREKVPTFMEDYLIRFDRSQQFMNLSRQIKKEEIREAVAELQKRNGFENSAFKLMLFAAGQDADEQLEPFFFILNIPASEVPSPESASLISYEYLREYPHIKSVNYLTSYHLHQQKKKFGAIDVLYHKDGLVTETSRSNIFIIRDGILRTPEKNVLEGINRKHILSMGGHELKIEVGDISTQEVFEADEVFVSSTLKEIMPIVRIDDHTIGDGQPGTETLRLKKLYREHLRDAAQPVS